MYKLIKNYLWLNAAFIICFFSICSGRAYAQACEEAKLGTSISNELMGQGAQAVIDANPEAQFFNYGFLAYSNEVVQELRSRSYVVNRYLNLYTFDQGAGNYDFGDLHRWFYDYSSTHPYLILRDENGVPLLFRWYPNALGYPFVINWANATPSDIAYLANNNPYLVQEPGPIFGDQVWPGGIRQYMLREGVDNGGPVTQEMVDQYSNPGNYRRNIMEFIRQVKENVNGPRNRDVITNGDQSILPQYGIPVTFENANYWHLFDFNVVLEAMANCPECIVEMNPMCPNCHPQVGINIESMIAQWLNIGGKIFYSTEDPGDRELRDYYISRREAACNTPPPPPNSLPTVVIVSPSDGEKVSGVVSITVDARDDGSIHHVDFLVDGILEYTSYTAQLKGGFYRYDWDTRGYTNGSHELEAVAVDNEEGRASYSINVYVKNSLLPSTNAYLSAPGQGFLEGKP